MPKYGLSDKEVELAQQSYMYSITAKRHAPEFDPSTSSIYSSRADRRGLLQETKYICREMDCL